MKFVSLRDFRTRTSDIRKDLSIQHEIVLTANGRPIAIIAQVDEDNFEERLKALRRSRARAILDRIQAKAKARGVDKLTMKQIDAIIAETRRERQSGE
ncbi:MAG: type II toxin-antitoxin system Phd/YefM family antitoxin [Firmicutes bacterium]|nr:type II toxin-antitoxin system Phd/YefM family antitoxin [Bacillota bacterium]